MKALRFFSLLFICVTLLCSCAAPEKNDVYYIHACGFDEKDNRLIFTVLLEKSVSENENTTGSDSENSDIAGMSDNGAKADTKYFTDSFDGDNIGECAQSFFEKYPDCYSGKNDVYLFSESLDPKKLYEIAVFIPSVPGLPAGSGAMCVSSITCSQLLKTAADGKQNDAPRFNRKNKKVNAVRFFAMCTSENREIKIPLIKYDKSAGIQFDGKALYKNCAVVTW